MVDNANFIVNFKKENRVRANNFASWVGPEWRPDRSMMEDLASSELGVEMSRPIRIVLIACVRFDSL